MMPAKAGICREEGCGRARRQGSALCRAHHNQHIREVEQAERDFYKNGLVELSRPPQRTRRCLVCDQVLPNNWLLFNLLRDRPPRYFCICRFCDKSALIVGLTIDLLGESIQRMQSAPRWNYATYHPFDLRPARFALEIADELIRSKRGEVPRRGSWDDEFEQYLSTYLEKKRNQGQ